MPKLICQDENCEANAESIELEVFETSWRLMGYCPMCSREYFVADTEENQKKIKYNK